MTRPIDEKAMSVTPMSTGSPRELDRALAEKGRSSSWQTSLSTCLVGMRELTLQLTREPVRNSLKSSASEPNTVDRN